MERIRGEKSDTVVFPTLETVYSRSCYVHFNHCVSVGQMDTTDVHEDELIDGIDVLWGGDEMGSGTDEDDSDGDMEESFVSLPPSEDVIERQIRDEFTQWKKRTSQCTDLQDQDCQLW